MRADASGLQSYDVAIVGAGFSGVAAVLQIARQALTAKHAVSCVMFEPRDAVGAGVAYSAQSFAYLLNVPASKMSFDDEFPTSFVNWLSESSHNFGPNDFAPRRLYHEYLASLLGDLNQDYFQLKIIKNTVCGIKNLPSGVYQLETADQMKFETARVVIAVGNSPVSVAQTKQVQKLLKSPWDASDIVHAARTSKIALIGTGLTAVDTVLALEEAQFKGTYTLISRKGLLPKPHPDEATHEPLDNDITQRLTDAVCLQGLVKEIRSLIATGIEWHILIDAMRPYSHRIWQRLSIKEKRRFIQHLRAFWDCHRHRIPQQSLNVLQRLKDEGRLNVLRARADSYRDENSKVCITATARGQQKSLGPFDAVFSCTGVWTNLEKCNSPLIRSMIENNLATYDDLFLGFKSSSLGELINQQGRIAHGIYTLGPLRRGELWETTAVREIRQQAKEIAKAIVADITNNYPSHNTPRSSLAILSKPTNW